MGLNDLYTSKQLDILKTIRKRDWFMLINHGAVRTGKTVLDNDIFLMELRRVRKIADKHGVRNPMYILGGVSSKTIQTNVLTELSNKYGIEFRFDKHNNFELFGVKVILTYTGSIGGLGAIRGMTAYGAYINEASLANREVFAEIIKRCSGDGARIVCDTNPDNPEHWLKRDYIDKAGTELGKNILEYHFELQDNTFLTKRYVDNLIAATPSGVFMDRDIHGLWVAGQGVVYPDFDKNLMAITAEEAAAKNFDRVVCGVDWGWEHWGSIVVVGVVNGATASANQFYFMKEYAHQHYAIDDWVRIAKGIVSEYGSIPFYCDSARPEHVARFQQEGFNAMNANKAVMPGVETVAKAMKQRRFFVVYDEAPRFRTEIYSYVWNEKTGVPEKVMDDTQDALRYAIYSDTQMQQQRQRNDVKQRMAMARTLGF